MADMAADRTNDLHRNVHYFIDGSLDGDKARAAFHSEGGHGAKRLSDVYDSQFSLDLKEHHPFAEASYSCKLYLMIYCNTHSCK